ncbi:UDP-glucuronosyltransferase 2B7 isoform X2 [Grammomys surdaster]|uniref:UDP-glucuronosyltransferase 2B7 isoform X2 n=1 Tax=Grammomys surdaster TaxID=491861 RepID=UPI00109F344B|nr:UDP-glucuronosyltransferase 2B7 isoform X2 [Grammomys surdaster]
MPVKWISTLLLLQMGFCIRSGNCGKVLVWPMEYSHWMNLKIILDELVQRGHEVTVLRPSSSIFLDPKKASGLIYETFPTASNNVEVEKFFTQWVNTWTYDVPKDTCLRYYPSLNIMFHQFSDLWLRLCREVVSNKGLIEKLKKSKFDVVLSDAVGPCGELIAELLQLPFVYSLRFGNGYGIEKYSGRQLFPPSYVPIILSGLSGQMTFMERVENMICLLYFDFWYESFPAKDWDPFFSEILGRPTTMVDTMKKAEMWLIRSYWDLEFPRPSLPNIEFVGGLHCKPAKPLPKEMEEFAQSSGEHGVVVFSLGSMIRNITQERANTIASALAQIPQKVLWRFEGKKPDTLGPNTRVFKWMPQNDLLEQHDNIAHMVAKGAAVSVDFHTMSSSDLLNALKAVINNPSYKENVMWLSTIHHDQPMKPLDRAVFWIEFVMRHKGAKHLRPLGHNLTWYQYHSLDVIGFLLTCVVAIAFLAVKCCLFVYRFFVKKRKNKKD